MAVFDLEINGPNVIKDSERSGKARSLFWPWAGAPLLLLFVRAASPHHG